MTPINMLIGLIIRTIGRIPSKYSDPVRYCIFKSMISMYVYISGVLVPEDFNQTVIILAGFLYPIYYFNCDVIDHSVIV